MKYPYSILIAEDETGIRILIRDFLKKEGYKVVEATNGIEALTRFKQSPNVDLVILDVMMPVLNGWEVCQEIRQTSHVPVIFLTALDDTQDQLRGFKSGADDYIVKPFEYQIFMARVKAMLKRNSKFHHPIFQHAELSVDKEARQVKVSGLEITLASKEYELLEFLIENKNIALDRETILNNVWGSDFFGDERTVDTHIKNLRSKLGPVGECIKTVRGHGYRLEV